MRFNSLFVSSVRCRSNDRSCGIALFVKDINSPHTRKQKKGGEPHCREHQTPFLNESTNSFRKQKWLLGIEINGSFIPVQDEVVVEMMPLLDPRGKS